MVVNPIISPARVKEDRGAYNGMCIGILFAGFLVSSAVGKDVIIHFQTPMADLNRPVRRHHNITGKHITAVLKPYVRMERVIDYDIVFYYPIEAFTQFDASVQTQIVINVVITGAVVQFNVPTSVAAKTIIP